MKNIKENLAFINQLKEEKCLAITEPTAAAIYQLQTDEAARVTYKRYHTAMKNLTANLTELIAYFNQQITIKDKNLKDLYKIAADFKKIEPQITGLWPITPLAQADLVKLPNPQA